MSMATPSSDRTLTGSSTDQPPPTDDAAEVPGRRPLTGVLLIASSALAAIGSLALMRFGWPGVLDEPAAIALPAFAKDETVIRGAFYLQLVSSLLLIPAAIGVQAVLTRGSAAVRVFTTFGIAGAMFQLLGWVRWPVVVPGLAERYLDPAATETTRAATGAAYDVLNAYAGGALGEHLGWLFQGPWALALGVFALTARGVPRWVGWTGLLSAAVWVPLIVPEPFVSALGGNAVTALAFTAYSIWFVWVAVLGIVLITRRVAPPAA